MVQIRIRRALAFVALLAAMPLAQALRAADKKPITHDVYDSWRSIQGTQLSRDGTWLVYSLVPQDGDGEIVARNLKTGTEYRHPRGKPPLTVTADAAYVVFTIAPLKADVDKAKKDKKKPEDQPKSGVGIMALASGQVATVDRVKSFKVPEESAKAIAYLMEPLRLSGAKGDDKKEPDAEKKEDTAKKKEKKKD